MSVQILSGEDMNVRENMNACVMALAGATGLHPATILQGFLSLAARYFSICDSAAAETFLKAQHDFHAGTITREQMAALQIEAIEKIANGWDRIADGVTIQ